MSGPEAHSARDTPLATLRFEVDRLWRELADATAAASQAGVIPLGTRTRADLDTAQSALAHALRELRVGEGRSVVERSSDSDTDTEPAPPLTPQEARERLAGWRASVEQMSPREWHEYVPRAAAEDAMDEPDQPAEAGAPEPEFDSAPQPRRDAPTSAPWGGRLRAVARQLVELRQALADAGEIDPLSAEWGPLTVAAGLVELAADSVDALPAIDPAPASAAGDAAILGGLEAATGAIPTFAAASDEPRATDERAGLVAALLPRLHVALADALADLSLHELRALAAHPDATAALVLLVGLATRRELLDPGLKEHEAASLLAEPGRRRGWSGT